ncbi:MAG: transcription elongation factor GreA [Candidatus Omnitrophota bacterium]
MDDIYLTRQGYEKMLKKLELITARRKEFSAAIEHARGLGDISENAEYDAAKEAQAQNERRIVELQDKLSRVRILEEEGILGDCVRIGATVKLRDTSSNEEIEYTLVAEEEADYSQNKISTVSPVGRGLLGHKKGEVVKIEIPAGILRYEIIDIRR